MTAMFPDSGVPASDARNSTDPATVNCSELWYSTSRCQPRFDPAAANAVLSELTALINKGEVSYNCNSLDQIQLAVRYLIQRGLATAVNLAAGPFDYIGYLDPPLTRYNDHLTLIIVPNVDNQGAVQLNLDGRGLTPLLRNDLLPLQSKDLRANVPALISYFAGRWTMVGLASSQVPLVVIGGVDAWVRTDGNDTTADGTANTPDKAFRTIKAAWDAVGSRYAATPLFSINIRLGIPGDYEGAMLGPYGGVVTLSGDTTNPAAYRIKSRLFFGNTYGPLWVSGMADFILYGVTMLIDQGGTNVASGFWGLDSQIRFVECHTQVAMPGVSTRLISLHGATFAVMISTWRVFGNNNQIAFLIYAEGGAYSAGAAITTSAEYGDFYFNDCNLAHAALGCIGISTIKFSPNARIFSSNVTGQKYHVGENSIIAMGGQPCPGTTDGVMESGGRFIL